MRPNVSELLEKINRLAARPGFPALSAIERDLLKHYLRELYEWVDVPVQPAASLPVTDVAEQTPRSEDQETLQPELLITREPVREPAIENTPLRTKADYPFWPRQLLKQQHEEVAQDEQPSTTESPQEVQVVKASLNEKVQQPEGLNEKMKGKATEIHRQLASKPIRELIDFNHKFAIVNELFKGDVEAFAQAIHTLDTAESFEAAQDFIQHSLVRVYGWNESSQSTRLLLKLVRQRFGVA